MKHIVFAVLVGSVFLSSCGSRDESDSALGTNISPQFGANGEILNGSIPQTGAATAGTIRVRATSNDSFLETGGSVSSVDSTGNTISTDPAVATITALVTNQFNQAMAEQEIQFASSGGVLQNISAETDENGRATATLSLDGEYVNQQIMVTVAAGSATDTVLVTSGGTNLDIAGPSQLVLGASTELTITLTAGNGQPIPNELVTLTSSALNTLTPASGTTDSNGRITVEVTSDNGSDTITATALDGVSGNFSISVNPDLLAFMSVVDETEFPVGAVQPITVEWQSDGAPVVGRILRFDITAGQIISSPSVLTDSSGRAIVEVVSTSAGPATITVAADDGPVNRIDIEFVATTPAYVQINSSSTRVSTNDGLVETTSDESLITATVTDANGNPVKNQEVIFSSTDLKGGQLNPAVAVTDSKGKAITRFVAGPNASEFQEILITAVVEDTTITDETRLTVVERRLNITIGTSGFLEILAGGLQYGMPFAVQVADGGGAPLKDATVEVSIAPIWYRKGRLSLVPTGLGDERIWESLITAECLTEDENGNRILDLGEDLNGNGVLDPQDPALIGAHNTEVPTVINGLITTDANGSGYFTMIYPASSSEWSKVSITARANALSVEAEETYETVLRVLAERVDDEDDNPPNVLSPYGQSGVCTDEL